MAASAYVCSFSPDVKFRTNNYEGGDSGRCYVHHPLHREERDLPQGPAGELQNSSNHTSDGEVVLSIFRSALTQPSPAAGRFEKHWFPEVPAKGQGYRCIRVNGLSPVDITLQRAASKCGLSYSDLRLPTELTVWVDPSEVCYRYLFVCIVGLVSCSHMC